MGAHMVHVAYVVVPAVALQLPVPGGEAPVQFSELGCHVAGLFQHFREEYFLRGGLDACPPGGLLFKFLIAPALFFRRDDQASGSFRVGFGVAVMHAHEQGGTRRAAVLAAVAPGEHDALFGKTVDIGRFDEALAVASQQSHAHVVRINEDDVGFGRGYGCLG